MNVYNFSSPSVAEKEYALTKSDVDIISNRIFKEGGADDGFGLKKIGRLETATEPIKIYFAGEESFVYCKDKYLYRASENGLKREGMLSFDRAPDIQTFSVVGKNDLFAVDNGTFYSLDDFAQIFSVPNGQYYAVIDGIIYVADGDVLYYANAADISGTGNAARIYSMIFDRTFGYPLSVIKNGDLVKVICSKSIHAFSIGTSLTDVKLKSEYTFDGEIIRGSVIKYENSVYFLKDGYLYEYKEKPVEICKIADDIQAVSETATFEGKILFKTAEGKGYLYEFRSGNVAFVSLRNCSLSKNGDVLNLENGELYRLQKNASEGYLQTRKIKFIKGKRKSHLTAAYFYSSGSGVFFAEGDFGKKEYAITEGDNYFEPNIFSEYFSFNFHLNPFVWVADIKFKYTE